jgi:hypothetical protein
MAGSGETIYHMNPRVIGVCIRYNSGTMRLIYGHILVTPAILLATLQAELQ